MSSHAFQSLVAVLFAAALGVPAPARADEFGALAVVSFVMPARAAPKAAVVVATAPRPALPVVEPAPAAPPPEAPAPDAVTLHKLSQSLWDDFTPEAWRADHELLRPEEFSTLVQRLCAAGQSADLGRLAGFAPEARRAITSLRARPGFEDYAAWLQNQLDEIDAAEAAQNNPDAPLFTPPPPVASADTPSAAPPPAPDAPAPARLVAVPYYELWLDRVATRPRPSRADEFLPSLRAAFAAEGVPPALVWLAETESSFNPRARNPVGARGLFQIMPETARSLGLGLWPDERVHPVRSAHAAAS